MTSPLSLQGLSLDSLPSSASDPLYQPLLTSLLDSAHSLVASLEQPSTWRPRKTYNTSGASTSTSSCSSPPGPAPLPPGLNWHQRASVHSSASFDQFKEGLLKDHSKHEQEYVESCVKAERVSVIKEGVLEGEWMALTHWERSRRTGWFDTVEGDKLTLCFMLPCYTVWRTACMSSFSASLL